MSQSMTLCKSRRISLYRTFIPSANLFLWGSGIFFKSLPIVSVLLKCTAVTEVSDVKARVTPALPFSYQALMPFLDRITPKKAFPALSVLQSIHFTPSVGHHLVLGHNKQWFLRGRLEELPWLRRGQWAHLFSSTNVAVNRGWKVEREGVSLSYLHETFLERNTLHGKQRKIKSLPCNLLWGAKIFTFLNFLFFKEDIQIANQD